MLKYNEFLLESSKDNIIIVILDSLEQTLEEMLQKIEATFIEKGEKPFTPWQSEMYKLNLVYDLIKSVESYTLPGDTLISINSTKSHKGNLEISAKINRGNESFYLNTEVIYAGGYNIQKLHYRYLTKTNLPRTKSNVIQKMYAEKIKKMSKLEKLNKEIENNLKSIILDDEMITKNSLLTDSQILELLSKKDNSLTRKWDDVPKDAPAKMWGKEKWEEQQQIYINSSIEHWKTVNIKWSQQHKDAMLKNNEKLKQKINSYL